jgi:hypothetical protein
VTQPGDLVVDPAAGSFAVMHVAMAMGRDFIGCDKAYRVQQDKNADRTRDLAYRMTAVAMPGAGVPDIPDFLRRPVP